MKLYISKKETVSAPAVVLDDMILTTDLPTTAGSKMLDNYKSLFGATVIEKLTEAGYSVAGKANVGELGIDLLGETSYFGAVTDKDGNLLEGYDSGKVFGDTVDRKVFFPKSLAELAGKEVRIEISMKDADLYSFKFDTEVKWCGK